LLSKWDSGPSLEVTRRARALVGDSIRRLRKLVFELKPVELEEEGLATAVRLLLERTSNEGGFTYKLDDRLSGEIRGPSRYLFYRVLQEAIGNVFKHSGASHVDVDLRERDGGIWASVRDDGVGFIASSGQDNEHHFGLTDMAQRSEAAGGWCRVDAEVGKGTTIEVWFPIAHDDLERRVA
jgi:signal transduction histidine kinase